VTERIDYEVYDGISGADELALVAARLADSSADAAPRLMISRLTGHATALGRHQRETTTLVANHGQPLLRRLGSGRATAYGDGQVSLCLIVPDLHAYAGVHDPIKVINRGVRGLLRALKTFGLRAIYGGRDMVTVQRRPVALLSMEALTGEALSSEALPGGVCMFQAIIGLSRQAMPDSACLQMAAAAGLGGEPWMPLAEVVDAITFERLVEAIVSGYGKETGRELLPSQPDAAPAPLPNRPGDGEGYTWSAPVTVPIGRLQAGVRVADGSLADTALCGDFIVGSAALVDLSAALSGAAPEPRSVGLAVDRVFAGELGHSILGVSDLGVIRDAILQAAADDRGQHGL